MGFKEQVLKDIENVFFNINEFGEKVVINNMSVIAIIENIKHDVYASNTYDTSIIGIDKKYIKVYLKADDIKNMELFISQQILLQDKYYVIEEIEQEQGITILTLSVVSSR